MATERRGSCGVYYGSTYIESEHLTQREMEVNATYIYVFLSLLNGWTINAVSALLGNMQAESSINPGRWQSEDIFNVNMGYSLVQWTPATKYILWCDEQGYNDPSEMDNALNRILYEVENKIQWYATPSYNFSFSAFTQSNDSVGELAKAFLLNYERPADQSASVQAYRASLAENWYRYLTGQDPDVPTPTPTGKKNEGYNFLLFNRRKRVSKWRNRNF